MSESIKKLPLNKSKEVSMEVIKNGGEYLSCKWLNHGVRFDLNFMAHCSMAIMHPKTNIMMDLPRIIDNVNQNISLEDLLSYIGRSKLDFIHRLANCDVDKETDFVCANCFFKEYKYWQGISDDKFQLKYMVMVPHHTCNSRCYYCYQDHDSTHTNYDLYELVQLLVKKGNININDIRFIGWEGGEPVLMPNFEKMFALLEKNVKRTHIPTSAIKYSDIIEKSLSMRNLTQILVSIDAGTKETYLKVKQVNQFERVVTNIKRYYEHALDKSRIKIKYIVLPENCSFEEIDSFYDMIIDNNIVGISPVVSRNFGISPTLDISLGVLYFHIQSMLRLNRYVEPITEDVGGVNVHVQNVSTILSQLVENKRLGIANSDDELLSAIVKISKILPFIGGELSKLTELQQLANSIIYKNDATRKFVLKIDQLMPVGSTQREIAERTIKVVETIYYSGKSLYEKIKLKFNL